MKKLAIILLTAVYALIACGVGAASFCRCEASIFSTASFPAEPGCDDTNCGSLSINEHHIAPGASHHYGRHNIALQKNIVSFVAETFAQNPFIAPEYDLHQASTAVPLYIFHCVYRI